MFLFCEAYGPLSEAEYASVALPPDKFEMLLDEIDDKPYAIEDVQDIRWAILDELGAWQPWSKLTSWAKPLTSRVTTSEETELRVCPAADSPRSPAT